jgi:hypothetical protein
VTDRALLFLMSLAVLVGAIAAAIWVIRTGQAGTFDGNFLLAAALVVATAFGLYLRFMIRRAMEPPPQKPAPAAKKTAFEQEQVGKI